MPERIWTCKIGAAESVPPGGDFPMREAIARAYRELTGSDPEFIFSGWGGELTEGERACVEDRLPDPNVIVAECRKTLDDTLAHMASAQSVADAAPSRPAGNPHTPTADMRQEPGTDA